MLIAYLAISKKVPNEEMLRTIGETVDKETLGRNLRLVKKIVDFGDSGIKAIEYALERRNYLTHHFFRENAFEMHNIEGREKMVNALDEMRKAFDIADALLQSITKALLKCAGVSELVESELNKVLSANNVISSS